MIDSAVGSRIDMINVAYGNDIEQEGDEESGDDKVDEFNMLCENVRKEVIEEFVKENFAMAESVKARLMNDIG
ncbi:hypothetical protein CR157_15865 [Halomonas sp. LBP4]|nr:hypothetical protein CR157_15865 [Halomonas sp. LBP4]